MIMDTLSSIRRDKEENEKIQSKGEKRYVIMDNFSGIRRDKIQGMGKKRAEVCNNE